MHKNLFIRVVAVTRRADSCEISIESTQIYSRHRPSAGELKQDVIAWLEWMNVCLETNCQARRRINISETKRRNTRAECVVCWNGVECK